MHAPCKDSRLNNRIKKLIMDKHIKQKKKKVLKRKLRLSETAIDKGTKEFNGLCQRVYLPANASQD